MKTQKVFINIKEAAVPIEVSENWKESVGEYLAGLLDKKYTQYGKFEDPVSLRDIDKVIDAYFNDKGNKSGIIGVQYSLFRKLYDKLKGKIVGDINKLKQTLSKGSEFFKKLFKIKQGQYLGFLSLSNRTINSIADTLVEQLADKPQIKISELWKLCGARAVELFKAASKKFKPELKQIIINKLREKYERDVVGPPDEIKIVKKKVSPFKKETSQNVIEKVRNMSDDDLLKNINYFFKLQQLEGLNREQKIMFNLMQQEYKNRQNRGSVKGAGNIKIRSILKPKIEEKCRTGGEK